MGTKVHVHSPSGSPHSTPTSTTANSPHCPPMQFQLIPLLPSLTPHISPRLVSHSSPLYPTQPFHVLHPSLPLLTSPSLLLLPACLTHLFHNPRTTPTALHSLDFPQIPCPHYAPPFASWLPRILLPYILHTITVRLSHSPYSSILSPPCLLWALPLPCFHLPPHSSLLFH